MLDKPGTAAGVRLVTLQAGVALGEIIAEERLLCTRLEENELLPARHVNEQGQEQGESLLPDNGIDAHDQGSDEAGTDGQRVASRKPRRGQRRHWNSRPPSMGKPISTTFRRKRIQLTQKNARPEQSRVEPPVPSRSAVYGPNAAAPVFFVQQAG